MDNSKIPDGYRVYHDESNYTKYEKRFVSKYNSIGNGFKAHKLSERKYGYDFMVYQDGNSLTKKLVCFIEFKYNNKNFGEFKENMIQFAKLMIAKQTKEASNVKVYYILECNNGYYSCELSDENLVYSVKAFDSRIPSSKRRNNGIIDEYDFEPMVFIPNSEFVPIKNITK